MYQAIKMISESSLKFKLFTENQQAIHNELKKILPNRIV